MSDQEQHAPPPEPGCPRCSAPLVPGRPACGACGLRLVGEDAAALWELDQQLAQLQHRRAGLLAALAAEPAAAPAAPGLPAAPPGALHPPAGPPVPPVPPAARRQRRFGAQQLLLVTGVVLVAAGAFAFRALVWGAIGALGQALVLLAVCAGAAAASRATARRALGASAEALAVVSVVVLLVVLGAARGLDVLGLGATDADAYGLGALLVAVGACAAGDRWLRPGAHPAHPAHPVAPAWAAVLLTAAVPTALALAVDGELLTWAAAALALAVLSAPASRLLGARARGLGAVALAVGAAHLAVAVLLLLSVDVGADAVPGSGPDASAPHLAALELALLALAAAWTAGRAGRPAPEGSAPATAPLAGRPQLLRTAVVVAHGGVIGALVSLAAAGGAFALLLLALGVSAVAAVLLAARPHLLPWPVTVAALALAGGSLLSEPVVGSSEDTWWRPTAWYALALASLLAGARRPVASAPLEVLADRRALPVPRAVWAAAGSAAALGGVLAAPDPVPGVLPVVLALVVASVLLALSAAVRGAPEAVLAAGWGLTSLVALLMTDGGAVPSSVPLAVAGLGALARAGHRRRTAWALPAVLLLSAAWWSEADRVVPSSAEVEWWSLPPAALALAVGVLVWQRHPRLGSWAVLGPGLAVALLPSALQAAVTNSPWRTAAVAVAGALVCWAGVRWSLQAPVALGAAAAVVVAVGQLGPYARQVPVAVGLFLAGAVVLLLAVRIEQARRDAARAVGWVRALR